MDNLTPITREEILMNDEPLTPITREEKILAGEDLNPVTRREYFLKKYRHAGGDVMVEGLEVTANGTYTAPENKAYSPVEVAVPLPENAYLLKTASGSLVSFPDGADLPMPSFICNIDAVQDLHGYDSPWVGGAGKNKANLANGTRTGQGITATVADQIISVSGTATTTYANINYFNEINIISGGTYTVRLSKAVSNDIIFRFATDTTDTTYQQVAISAGSTSATFTANNNFTVFRLYVGSLISGTDVNISGLQVLVGEGDVTDFAPYSNICPISGHTGVDACVRGKNLVNWKWNTFNDGKMEIFLKGGTYTLSAESTLSDGKGYIRGTKPSGEYVSREELGLISWNPTTTSGLYYGGSAQQQTYTFNVPNGGAKIEFGKINNNGTISAQLESGSTASTYTPYNPNSQTIQVSWQTEAGEVFGGYVDLVSGLLTVTHKSQTGFTRGSQDSSNKLYKIGAISDIKAYANVSAISPYYVDSMFEKMSLQGARAAETPSITHHDHTFYVGGYIGKEAELDTLLETLQVKYELETPITYQLTPQQIKSLRGNNNAWCDTGDVTSEYFGKEVKEFGIQKRTTQIERFYI